MSEAGVLSIIIAFSIAMVMAGAAAEVGRLCSVGGQIIRTLTSALKKHEKITAPIHSFINSGHFYSASSNPLLIRGAPDYSTDTVSEFYAEAHRQL